MAGFIDKTNKSLLQYNIVVSDRVKELCDPLCGYLGFSYIAYARLFYDHSYCGLSNANMEFAKRYVERVKCHDEIFGPFINEAMINKPNFFLWPEKKENLGDILSFYNELNIWHGINIAFRRENFIDIFTFAFEKGTMSSSQTFFLANSYILIKFAEVFAKQAEVGGIINDHDLSTRGFFHNNFVKRDNIIDEAFDKFIQQISFTSNLRIRQPSGQYVRLSKREYDCINLLIKCKTIKQTALQLGISPRTAESHISSIKVKLGVNYKSELIDILEMNNFI